MTTHTTPPCTAHRRSAPIAFCLTALAVATSCSSQAADASRVVPTSSTSSAHSAHAATTPGATPVPVPHRSMPTPPSSLARPARPTGLRDDLVALDGAQMHIRCDGVGPSTVVLIAGFGSTSASWDAIVPTLTARTRVCAYDRPRLGSGEQATLANQTFTDQAAHLHELLASVGEPGPYVVVGHSFGGVAAVEFAERYVGDVAALVLVDTRPSDWPTQLCAVADDGTPAATALHEMCASWSHPSAGAELLDVFAAFAESSQPPSLGALPLTVLTAAERELPFGLAEAELARLTTAWNDGQVRWAGMSADSELISVADTSHFVQIDRPTVVLDAIAHRLPSI